MEREGDILLACLAETIAEPELVKDIAEACHLGGIGLKELAVSNIEHIEQQLFLTPEEARKLQSACQQAVEAPGPVAQQEPPEELPTCVVSVPGEKAEVVPADGRKSKLRPASAPPSRSPAAACLRQHPGTLTPRAAKVVGGPAAFSTPPCVRPGSAAVSRVMAPTAAFLARVVEQQTGSKQAREASEAAAHMRASQKLEAVMAAPQGQRVTKPVAFSLRAPKPSAVLSTEEVVLLEAKKNAFKPHAVPKHLRESVSIEGFARVQTAPQDPATLFKPFKLSSAAKHAEYQQKQAQRLAEEQAKAEQARLFKAQSLDKAVLTKVPSPRKPAPVPTTSPVPPRFASDMRMEHWKEVVGPARRARLTPAEREKLEAAERQAAAEAAAEAQAAAERQAAKAREAELQSMSVAQLRKTMQFKARPLPDFRALTVCLELTLAQPPVTAPLYPCSSPFKLDHSKALPVTQSVDFSLKTDARLGRALPVKDRQDAAAPAIRDFTGSLRASGTFVHHSPGGGAAALRRSVALPSSQPASPKPRTPGGAAAAPSTVPRASLRSQAAACPQAPLATQLSEALHEALGPSGADTPAEGAACTASPLRAASDLLLDSTQPLVA
ncbi:hypothetical protein QJQ45_018010 [Haematococcus lacustris]|nr:hypothetical protein QJQ45_018010 [Haematococcus lacustris]